MTAAKAAHRGKTASGTIWSRVLILASLSAAVPFPHAQAQSIDAEACVNLFDALLEERRDPDRVPHRAGEADRDLRRLTVDPAKFQLHPTCTLVVTREMCAEPVEKSVKTGHHIGLEPDGLRQGHSHPVMRRLGFG